MKIYLVIDKRSYDFPCVAAVYRNEADAQAHFNFDRAWQWHIVPQEFAVVPEFVWIAYPLSIDWSWRAFAALEPAQRALDISEYNGKSEIMLLDWREVEPHKWMAVINSFETPYLCRVERVEVR